MINKYRHILLGLILILAFALRFYSLSDFPVLNADEAALGYNAWSLAETGKDEHGNPWPIHLQSFNDYKPALYAYLTIPIIYLRGLDTLAVRIPGALSGVLTVGVIYFLAKETAKNQKSQKRELFALSSALFLAISPWHVHFSRGGWEVNLATFFITLGVLAFLKALDRPKLYYLSFLSFVLSLYTYHASRVVVPLIGFGLLIIFYKENIKNWKQILISGFVAIALLIPLTMELVGPAGLSRAAGVGIFSDPGPLNEINEQRGEHQNLSGIGSKLFHNKPLNYTLAIFENWGEHFSGNFLFISGDDIQRNKVPEHGQMYLHDIVFLVAGLFAIAKSLNKRWGFVLYWLIIAPAAAALTFQSPHALRSQNMVIPLVLLTAYGFTSLVLWGKSKIPNKFALFTYYLLLATFLFWGFARYQQSYWVHMPRAYPYSSQYGVEEMVSYIKANYADFEKIVITDRYDQPYILTLFYLKYPPKEFQGSHELSARDGYGFSTVRNFDKFIFTSIGDWSQVQSGYPNSLIVGTDSEIPDEANIVKTIYFPNGEVAFKIVAN